jgi:menaquinone-9 beta-reductase
MDSPTNIEIYDVIIVGAGPAGTTCAFYLAQANFKVLLLEKEKFPRNKVCGDAFTQRTFIHLDRMGILDRLIKERKAYGTAVGGLISPNGTRFSVDSASNLKTHLVYAIKRVISDEEMAKSASQAGTVLIENYKVSNVLLSSDKSGNKVWEVTSSSDQSVYRSRVLVAANNAVSSIAKSLGLIDSPPQAICSSIYIQNDKFDEDGLIYYPPDLVPGYISFFREADGDLGMCVYIIPGGKYGPKDLKRVHYQMLEDPTIKEFLGPEAVVEDMKAAPIRFGGIPRPYGERLLVIGDAAGYIDPLTGEGLQYAMDSGEIAAKVIQEAFSANDFSERFLSRFHRRCKKSFAKDFKWSSQMIKIITKHPILLDACAAGGIRKGEKFMTKWGQIMTGAKPKVHFLRPNLAFPLFVELIRQRWRKMKKEKV